MKRELIPSVASIEAAFHSARLGFSMLAFPFGARTSRYASNESFKWLGDIGSNMFLYKSQLPNHGMM